MGISALLQVSLFGTVLWMARYPLLSLLWAALLVFVVPILAAIMATYAPWIVDRPYAACSVELRCGSDQRPGTVCRLSPLAGGRFRLTSGSEAGQPGFLAGRFGLCGANHFGWCGPRTAEFLGLAKVDRLATCPTIWQPVPLIRRDSTASGPAAGPCRRCRSGRRRSDRRRQTPRGR